MPQFVEPTDDIPGKSAFSNLKAVLPDPGVLSVWKMISAGIQLSKELSLEKQYSYLLDPGDLSQNDPSRPMITK